MSTTRENAAALPDNPPFKFPVANRLMAQIDDCKEQMGKLNMKRDMLLRQIETLEDAVRELNCTMGSGAR